MCLGAIGFMNSIFQYVSCWRWRFETGDASEVAMTFALGPLPFACKVTDANEHVFFIFCLAKIHRYWEDLPTMVKLWYPSAHPRWDRINCNGPLQLQSPRQWTLRHNQHQHPRWWRWGWSTSSHPGGAEHPIRKGSDWKWCRFFLPGKPGKPWETMRVSGNSGLA